MTYFEQLEKIRALAITARTSVYNEEAMTALELAGCTAKKVNECVEALNAFIDFFEGSANLETMVATKVEEALKNLVPGMVAEEVSKQGGFTYNAENQEVII